MTIKSVLDIGKKKKKKKSKERICNMEERLKTVFIETEWKE